MAQQNEGQIAATMKGLAYVICSLENEKLAVRYASYSFKDHGYDMDKVFGLALEDEPPSASSSAKEEDSDLGQLDISAKQLAEVFKELEAAKAREVKSMLAGATGCTLVLHHKTFGRYVPIALVLRQYRELQTGETLCVGLLVDLSVRLNSCDFVKAVLHGEHAQLCRQHQPMLEQFTTLLERVDAGGFFQRQSSSSPGQWSQDLGASLKSSIQYDLSGNVEQTSEGVTYGTQSSLDSNSDDDDDDKNSCEDLSEINSPTPSSCSRRRSSESRGGQDGQRRKPRALTEGDVRNMKGDVRAWPIYEWKGGKEVGEAAGSGRQQSDIARSAELESIRERIESRTSSMEQQPADSELRQRRRAITQADHLLAVQATSGGAGPPGQPAEGTRRGRDPGCRRDSDEPISAKQVSQALREGQIQLTESAILHLRTVDKRALLFSREGGSLSVGKDSSTPRPTGQSPDSSSSSLLARRKNMRLSSLEPLNSLEAMKARTHREILAAEGYVLGGRIGKSSGNCGFVIIAAKKGERGLAAKCTAEERRGEGNMCEVLRREFEVLRRLRHPLIVEAVKLVEASSGSALVMEFARGVQLKDLLPFEGPLRPDLRHSTLSQILEAVKYIHGRDIAHRDLHGENLVVELRGEGEEAGVGVKVVDFGCARLSAVGDTTSPLAVFDDINTSIVSPNYLHGSDDIFSCDIYAVGLLCVGLMQGYQVLTKDIVVMPFNRSVTSRMGTSKVQNRGARIVLPDFGPNGQERTALANNFLHYLLDLDAQKRPRAQAALDALPSHDKWFQSRSPTMARRSTRMSIVVEESGSTGSPSLSRAGSVPASPASRSGIFQPPVPQRPVEAGAPAPSASLSPAAPTTWADRLLPFVRKLCCRS